VQLAQLEIKVSKDFKDQLALWVLLVVKEQLG
jgi:hypothetical protein